MLNRKYIGAILALVVIWPFSVSAAPVAVGSSVLSPTFAPLVHKLGFVIVKTFKTAAPEITGLIIKTREGRFRVIYKYKNFLISGYLLNTQGKDLTAEYAQRYIPKPNYAAVAKALADATGVVTEGKAGAPEVYVFADPNCYFCHKFWELTRDWVAKGKVRLHWVMVGFLKKSSAGRAAAIMAAADSQQALAEDQNHFDLKHEEGGIRPLNPIPKKWLNVLHKHTDLMKYAQFEGTPGLVFKNAHGVWRGMDGVPSMGQFAKMLGISS